MCCDDVKWWGVLAFHACLSRFSGVCGGGGGSGDL